MLSLVEPAELLNDVDTDGGLPFYELLELLGLTETEEDDVLQQVKAHPDGAWCKPAVGRAVTCCGKVLGAYALRDESYLGALCIDGCFSPYELAVLAPAARQAAAEEAARKEREELDRWEAAHAQEAAQRDELRARRETGRMFPLPVPRSSDVEDD